MITLAAWALLALAALAATLTLADIALRWADAFHRLNGERRCSTRD